MPYNQVDPKLPLLTMDGDVMSGVQGHILKNCPPVGWAPRPHGLAPVLPGLSPDLGATHLPPLPPTEGLLPQGLSEPPLSPVLTADWS